MAETLLYQPVLPDSVPVASAGELQAAQRQALLGDLLGTDYDYAHEAGLLDMFDYRPEIGRDPLLHILTGELKTNEHGDILPEGYHHEPSARHPETVVDRQHMLDGDNHHRKKYREKPFEPYQARVTIEGFRKHTAVVKKGVTESVPVSNVMFPKEYDALVVLQAIRQARETRDKSLDKPGRDGAIVATGYATMLDGETRMSIRMILDGQNEKVITAHPYAPKERGYMNLSEVAIQENLGVSPEPSLPKQIGAMSVKDSIG